MQKKRNFDFLTIIKYAFILFSFLVFNKLESNVFPYSLSLYIAFLYGGASLIVTPLLFISSFLIVGNTGLLISMASASVIFIIAFILFRRFKINAKYYLVAICALSLTVFLIIGDTNYQISLLRRAIVSGIIVILTLLSVMFCDIFKEKGLKIKLEGAEYLIFSVMVILFGVGVCHFTTPLAWKAVLILMILFSSVLYKGGTCILISVIFSLPLSIYYTNLTHVSVGILLSLSSITFTKITRHLSSVSIALIDLILQFAFNIYPSFSIEFFIPTFIGAIFFSFFPEKFIKTLKENLYAFREKQLVRKSINQNKNMISNRLFELSEVFLEMENAVRTFQKSNLDGESCKEIIAKQIAKEICLNCERKDKCSKSKTPSLLDLSKLIDIGFAKGKVSVIDLPLAISNNCTKQSNMIFIINRMLAEHKKLILENENHNQSRALIADLAGGVSNMLKKVALDESTQLKYQNKLERSLFPILKKEGFRVSELMIFGEENNLSLSLILTMREFSLSHLESVISKVLATPFSLFDRADITEDKCYLLFKKKPRFDAVFGITNCIKDGSESSGDTHSINKLLNDKFLVALSDGMGSGDYAKKVSSVSLSLIESLYKAGIDSNVILQTVNKLLAINTEDSFTALDISVVNLKTGQADFIKYGSPYGFIIGDDGIKIVEGNTLPLGILSELKPSVCSCNLSNGDMLLFVTDGVADAFNSANEIIDFLKGVLAKNPQTLTDQVIKKALSLSNGVKNDDMTALAVRIFDKNIESAV